MDLITRMKYENDLSTYKVRLSNIKNKNGSEYEAEIIVLKMMITLLSNLLKIS